MTTAPTKATMIMRGGLAETIYSWIENQAQVKGEQNADARRLGQLALDACTVTGGATSPMRLRVEITPDTWPAVADALDLAQCCDTLSGSTCAAAARQLDKMIANGWPDLRSRPLL